MHPEGFPNLTGNPSSAPRCGAKTRRGARCLAPAIRGKQRCRMHGGKGSGAPRRNQNAVTSGNYTAKNQAHRFFMSWLFWTISDDRRHLRATLSRRCELEALADALPCFNLEALAEYLRAEALDYA